MPTASSCPDKRLALRRIYHEVGHAIVADDFRVAVKEVHVSEDHDSQTSYANWPIEGSFFKRPAPWIVVDSIIAVAGAVAEVMLLDELDGVDVTAAFQRTWREEECGQSADLRETNAHTKQMLSERAVRVEEESIGPLIALFEDHWAWMARSILMRRWKDVSTVAAVFDVQYGCIQNSQFNTALRRDMTPA